MPHFEIITFKFSLIIFRKSLIFQYFNFFQDEKASQIHAGGMKLLSDTLCAAFKPSPTNTEITMSARPTFAHVAAQLFSSAGAVHRLAAEDPDSLRSRCGCRSAQSRPQRLSLPRCHSYQPFRCPPG